MVAALKAAGESTRLRLLALLADGELSVKDLTEILGQSQPRISRHLKLLADACLVLRHAEGAWAYFSLAPQGNGCRLAHWLVQQLASDDRQRLADAKRLQKLREVQAQQAAQYFSRVA